MRSCGHVMWLCHMATWGIRTNKGSAFLVWHRHAVLNPFRLSPCVGGCLWDRRRPKEVACGERKFGSKCTQECQDDCPPPPVLLLLYSITHPGTCGSHRGIAVLFVFSDCILLNVFSVQYNKSPSTKCITVWEVLGFVECGVSTLDVVYCPHIA